MRLSRKLCCTWRVKRSGRRADLLHHHRTGVRYGRACRRCASDVRNGPRWRIPEKFLRLRASNLAYPGDEHHLVGAIALLAINFDLVMATALINFGALVAFTFVNLSVISQFWIREKRNKTLKDHFQYLFLPMCGALTVGALWVNLEESSMVLGLIWAGIGLVYLACVTKSFRNPVPQYEDVA